MREIIDRIQQEIIKRSNLFEERTKGTKDEYNLYRDHIQFVHRYVIQLSKGSGADRDVLELSAFLHDISYTDSSLDRSKHNEYSALIAEELLRMYSCPEEKTQLVKKCILNHSSTRADFRTTIEEQMLVDADGLSHFDAIRSIYSLAHKVMELNDADALRFIQDKLMRDYLELSDGAKDLVRAKYAFLMKADTIGDLGI